MRHQGLEILKDTGAFSQLSLDKELNTPSDLTCLDIGSQSYVCYKAHADKRTEADILANAYRSHYLACGYLTLNQNIEQVERLSHVGYWRWHVSTDRVFYSPQWKAMLGYEDHEIQSDFSEWERLLHPDDRAESERQLAHFFSHLHASNISEFRLRCKDGSYRTIISKGRVVQLQDDQTSPEVIFGIHFPADELQGSIQDQQRLTTQLKRERTLRARAGEIADIGFWEVNMDSGYVYWNKKTRQIHGVDENYTPELATAINFYKEGDTRNTITQAIQDCLEQGRAFDLETEIVDMHGNEKWVRAIGIKDDSSEELRMFGLFQDIDQRKRAIAELEQARADMALAADRLALATNSAQIGVWEYNIASGELYWDKWMYEIYGITEEEFPGNVSIWRKSLHPDDTQATTLYLKNAIDNVAPFDCTFRILRPNGQVRYVKANAIIRRDINGEAIGMVGVNFDITEAQLASAAQEQARKAAEEANRAKSDFLASMSHELRTPMNGVLGMLQLMEGSMTQEINKRRLKTASNSAKNLLTILDDILDFSRIEAGKMELEYRPTSMSNLLQEMEEIFSHELKKKGIAVKIHNTLTHDFYYADEGRIRQLLINLIGNASKFTQVGSIVISAQESADKEVLLSVKDTGIGIPQDRLDKIFDSFTQADSSTTRKYGGSGLGLSICKRLSELMKGHISVRSELNQGSTFTLHLPLEPASLYKSQSTETTLLPPIQTLNQSHILLVEDNAINQIVINDMLTDLNAHIDTCVNGQEAIDFLTKTDARYDCILMDCQMPIMDGYDASRAIRNGKAGEEFKNIPIIALTANAMTGDKEKCLAAGMTDYLSKPVDIHDLRRAIEPFLKHS